MFQNLPRIFVISSHRTTSRATGSTLFSFSTSIALPKQFSTRSFSKNSLMIAFLFSFCFSFVLTASFIFHVARKRSCKAFGELIKIIFLNLSFSQLIVHDAMCNNKLRYTNFVKFFNFWCWELISRCFFFHLVCRLFLFLYAIAFLSRTQFL